MNFVACNLRNIQDEKTLPASLETSFFAELGEFKLELTSNINSPGTISVFSSKITPLVASVLFSLALAIGTEAAEAMENGRVIIGNKSSSNDDPCVVEVREGTLEFLRLVGFENWRRACEIAKDAADATGLKSPVSSQIRK